MGGFNFNPVLSEIQSHLQAMSPDAQAAVKMANPSIPSPQETAAAGAPSVIPPGMLLPHPDAGPPQGNISMPSPTPSLAPMSAPEVKAPRGTIEGDTNARGMLLGEKPGVDQIASRIEGSGFGQAHPFAGKLLGDTAQVAGKIGDTALGVGASLGIPALNTLAQDIPGTTAHHNQLLRQDNTALNQDVANAQKEAEANTENATAQHTNAETPEVAPEADARIGLQNATAGHENAETAALANPKGEWKELAGFTGANGEPLEINGVTGETRPVSTQGAKATNKKESNPQQETYDSLISGGMTPIQAYEKIREKPAGTTVNTGTWTLDEDENGKPTLFNTKTGETKAAPAGIQKAGTHAKAEAAEAGPRQAIEYATDYGSRSVHTGPGDEALMEKFFELAKPSTGFRMSQPQIDMLKNAQSWMSGLEAHLRHATTGTWFSDAQRQQIIGTMGDLAKAKGLQGQPNAPEGNAPAENWVRGPDGKLVKQ